ncbi:hypothetical protein CW304_19995 [Bacillus sp. UFRGS-B20]|nr:hypothetical protein CW304_19995 [Bacillus sp. UFRGS-B20]
MLGIFLSPTFLGLWVFGEDKTEANSLNVYFGLLSIGTMVISILGFNCKCNLCSTVGYEKWQLHGRLRKMNVFLAIIQNHNYWVQFPHTIQRQLQQVHSFIAGVSCMEITKEQETVVFKKICSEFLIIVGTIQRRLYIFFGSLHKPANNLI